MCRRHAIRPIVPARPSGVNAVGMGHARAGIYSGGQTMRHSAFLALVGCAVLLSVGVGTAAADNGPHVKGQGLTPDTCAACHRAHTGKAPYNLKENQEALCFTCHGTTGTGRSEERRIGKECRSR